MDQWGTESSPDVVPVAETDPSGETNAREGTDSADPVEVVAMFAPVELTGNEAVDAVLGTLDGLEDRSLGDRVQIFESAHDALRRTLNSAGEAPA